METGSDTTSNPQLRYDLLLTQDIGNVHQIKGYVLHDRIYLTIIRIELAGIDSISASYLCLFEPNLKIGQNRYSQIGSAKLTIIQNLPTHGRSHLELFSRNGENFMMITNLEITEGGDKHKIEFVLYKWDHAHMDVFLTRECTNAIRNKVFSIDGVYYLFVLQEKGKDGEGDIGSPLYILDFELKKARLIQILETNRPTDVAYIRRDDIHYLVIANSESIISSATRTKADDKSSIPYPSLIGKIDVWGWMYGQQFVKYQTLDPLPTPPTSINQFLTPQGKIGLMILENSKSTINIYLEETYESDYENENANFATFIKQGDLETVLKSSQNFEFDDKDTAKILSNLASIDVIQTEDSVFLAVARSNDYETNLNDFITTLETNPITTVLTTFKDLKTDAAETAALTNLTESNIISTSSISSITTSHSSETAASHSSESADSHSSELAASHSSESAASHSSESVSSHSSESADSHSSESEDSMIHFSESAVSHSSESSDGMIHFSESATSIINSSKPTASHSSESADSMIHESSLIPTKIFESEHHETESSPPSDKTSTKLRQFTTSPETTATTINLTPTKIKTTPKHVTHKKLTTLLEVQETDDLTTTPLLLLDIGDEMTETTPSSFNTHSEAPKIISKREATSTNYPQSSDYSLIKIQFSTIKRVVKETNDTTHSLSEQFKTLFEKLQETIDKVSGINGELNTILQNEAPQNITKDVHLNGDLYVDGNIKVENIYVRTNRTMMMFPKVDINQLRNLTQSTENYTSLYEDVLLSNAPNQTLTGFFEFLYRNLTVTQEFVCPHITVDEDVNGIYVDRIVQNCLMRQQPSDNSTYKNQENSLTTPITYPNNQIQVITGEWIIPKDKSIYASKVNYTDKLNTQTPYLASTSSSSYSSEPLVFQEVIFKAGFRVQGHVTLLGTLNGLDDFTASGGGIEYDDRTIIVRAKKTIEGNLKIIGDFNYVEDVDKRVNLDNWRKNEFLSLSKDQSINPNIALTFNGPLELEESHFSAPVNGIDLIDLIDNVILPPGGVDDLDDESYQIITGKKIFESDVKILKNVIFKASLNGQDIFRDFINIRENPSIFTIYKFIFTDLVTIEQRINIELVNGQNFSQDIFTGNTDQRITGNWTFANDVEFMGTTQIDEYKDAISAAPGVKINGFDLSETLYKFAKKRGYNRFKEEVIFDIPVVDIEGNITTEKLVSLNDIPVSDITNVWTTGTDQVIPLQSVSVKGQISVEEKVIANRVNGFNLREDFVITLPKSKKYQVNGGSNSYADQFSYNEREEDVIIIKSPVRFETSNQEIILIDQLVFDGNAKLNGIQPNSYLNKAIYIDTGVDIIVDGDLIFTKDLIFNEALNITKTLNGLDLYRDLVLNGSTQELTVTNLEPNLMVVVGDLVIRGELNVLNPEPNGTLVQGYELETFCNSIVHPSNSKLFKSQITPKPKTLKGIKVFTQTLNAEKVHVTGRWNEIGEEEFQKFISTAISIDPSEPNLSINGAKGLKFAGKLIVDRTSGLERGTQIKGLLLTTPIKLSKKTEYRNITEFLGLIVRAAKDPYNDTIYLIAREFLSGRKVFTQKATFNRGLNVGPGYKFNGLDLNRLSSSLLSYRGDQLVETVLNFEDGISIEELIVPDPELGKLFGHNLDEIYKLNLTSPTSGSSIHQIIPTLTIENEVIFVNELEITSQNAIISQTINDITFSEILTKLQSTSNVLVFNKDQEFQNLYFYGDVQTLNGMNNVSISSLEQNILLNGVDQIVESNLEFQEPVTFLNELNFTSINGHLIEEWFEQAFNIDTDVPQVIKGDWRFGIPGGFKELAKSQSTSLEIVVKKTLEIDKFDSVPRIISLPNSNRGDIVEDAYDTSSIDYFTTNFNRSADLTRMTINGFDIVHDLTVKAIHASQNPILVKSPLSYKNRQLMFEKDLQLDGTINGYRFPDDFIYIGQAPGPYHYHEGNNKEAIIHIPGHAYFLNEGGIKISKDITIGETINGVNLKTFSENVFVVDPNNDMQFHGKIVFDGKVKAQKDVRFLNTVNWIDIDNNIILKDGSSSTLMTGTKSFSSDITVLSDITSMEVDSDDESSNTCGKINRLHLSAIAKTLIQKGSDLELRHPIIFNRTVRIKSNINVQGLVNGHEISNLERIFENSIESFQADMTTLDMDLKSQEIVLESQLNGTLRQPSLLSYWEVSHTWPILTETFRYDFLRYYDSHFIYKWVHNSSGCPYLPKECRCDQMELLELTKNGKLEDTEILGHFRDFPMTVNLEKFENPMAVVGKEEFDSIKNDLILSSEKEKNIPSDVMIIVSSKSISYQKNCISRDPSSVITNHPYNSQDYQASNSRRKRQIEREAKKETTPDENTYIYILGNYAKLKGTAVAAKQKSNNLEPKTAEEPKAQNGTTNSKSFILRSTKPLSTLFVSDSLYFYRNQGLYIIIVNYFDKITESHNVDSYVYKFNFITDDWDLIQSIPTFGAISATVFISNTFATEENEMEENLNYYSNKLFMAIANNYDSVENSHSCHSYVYEWSDSTEQFKAVISVHTETARDVVSTTIKGTGYVVFANEKSAKAPESLTDNLYQEPITIFQHDLKTGKFVRIQDYFIPGVVKLDTFTVDDDHYLVAVSHVLNKIAIFEWREYTMFTLESEIILEGSRSAHVFWDRGHLYMAVGTLGSHDKLLVAQIKGNKEKDHIKEVILELDVEDKVLQFQQQLPHWVKSKKEKLLQESLSLPVLIKTYYYDHKNTDTHSFTTSHESLLPEEPDTSTSFVESKIPDGHVSIHKSSTTISKFENSWETQPAETTTANQLVNETNQELPDNDNNNSIPETTTFVETKASDFIEKQSINLLQVNSTYGEPENSSLTPSPPPQNIITTENLDVVEAQENTSFVEKSLLNLTNYLVTNSSLLVDLDSYSSTAINLGIDAQLNNSTSSESNATTIPAQIFHEEYNLTTLPDAWPPQESRHYEDQQNQSSVLTTDTTPVYLLKNDSSLLENDTENETENLNVTNLLPGDKSPDKTTPYYLYQPTATDENSRLTTISTTLSSMMTDPEGGSIISNMAAEPNLTTISTVTSTTSLNDSETIPSSTSPEDETSSRQQNSVTVTVTTPPPYGILPNLLNKSGLLDENLSLPFSYHFLNQTGDDHLKKFIPQNMSQEDINKLMQGIEEELAYDYEHLKHATIPHHEYSSITTPVESLKTTSNQEITNTYDETEPEESTTQTTTRPPTTIRRRQTNMSRFKPKPGFSRRNRSPRNKSSSSFFALNYRKVLK